MPPHTSLRLAADAGCLALALATLVAVPGARAAVSPFANRDSAVAERARDATVPDVIDAPLPGRESLESLKRALTTPSAESRWRGLPVFGRDLFGAEPHFAPVEDGPVGPDYVLGPGDNLVVFLSGYSDTSYALTLDREGKVFLPRVGAVFLWGQTFTDAERLIHGRLESVLRNTRVQVSMGRVRALDVFVVGAAVHPGKYTLTGLATALHALSAAGGPSALGSLRDVRVLRGDQQVARLDLYRFLLTGDRSNDARLQSGDVVFVALAKAHVGIQGAVVRPGVYETTAPVSLRELLDMAGGATAFADLERIRVERVEANGGFRLQDLPLDHGHGIDPDSLTLSNYDLVTVLPLEERMRNFVTLDGFVRHPGEYELSPGLTLSALIAPERLLPEADLERAELRRVDPHTFQVEVHAFSPQAVRGGEGDVVLQPLDAVSIFSSARFPRSVVLEGEVMRPGRYTVQPGERLSQVLERAGGVTPNGWLPAAVFLRASAADRERATGAEFVQRQRVELAQQRAHLLESGDSLAAEGISQAEAELVLALEHQTDPGRIVVDLDAEGRWVGSARDPELENGDRLIVPLRPATVTVVGSVMNPGSFLARRGASWRDYVRAAGGLSRQADLGRSYVLRANGAAVPRRSIGRIEAGDAIIVPPREVAAGGFGRAFGSSSRVMMELAGTFALIFAATRR